MYISAHKESLAESFINFTVQSNVKCFKSAFKINPPDSPSFRHLGLFGLHSTSVSFVLIVMYLCVYTYMCVYVRVGISVLSVRVMLQKRFSLAVR